MTTSSGGRGRGSNEEGGSGTCGNTRIDPGWKYGVQAPAPSDVNGKSYLYVKCNFCGKKLTGGINRLKHHLAKTRQNVGPCISVPKEVYEEMKALLEASQEKKKVNRDNFRYMANRGAYFEEGHGSVPGLSSMNVSHGHGPTGSHGQGFSGGSSTATYPNINVGPMDQFVVDLEVPDNANLMGAPRRGMAPNNPNAMREQVCLDIGRFFFENGLAFNVSGSPSFLNMVNSIANFARYNNGRAPKPPSVNDLRTWVLAKEVETTDNLVNKVKRTWPHTGVTIMSDGWKDMRGRQLINFLVNSPEGTVFLRSVDASDAVKDASLLFKLLDDVVEEVGEDNVVQVVTDNARNYKAAGDLLMSKRKKLYWTPCAAHCIDLILEDIYKTRLLASAYRKARKVSNYIYNHGWVLALMRKYTKRELIRPAATRFATGNLTLASLLRSRQPLESMFTSMSWANHPLSKQDEGKKVRKIVLKDDNFWEGLVHALNATKPLVHVLKIVESDENPAMGFLYNAMATAKDDIARNFNGDQSCYQEYWDIIDKRWDYQMQRSLHAAAYYLNPRFHYSNDFKTHASNAKIGLYAVLDKFITDPNEKTSIDLELDQFRYREGLFGRPEAERTIFRRCPASWWSAYGDSTPNLTNFAIRVLSLTCSSSGCERNWSTFNQVHTKRRNRLNQTMLNALVYIMFNKKLQMKKELRQVKASKVTQNVSGTATGGESDDEYLVVDDIESDCEWLVEPLPQEENATPPPAPKVIDPSPCQDWHQNLHELNDDIDVELADDEAENPNLQRRRKRRTSSTAGGSNTGRGMGGGSNTGRGIGGGSNTGRGMGGSSARAPTTRVEQQHRGGGRGSGSGSARSRGKQPMQILDEEPEFEDLRSDEGDDVPIRYDDCSMDDPTSDDEQDDADNLGGGE